MKKLVERVHIQEVYSMLNSIFLECNDPRAKGKLLNLMLYYDDHIMERSKENINELKRTIYRRMKEAKNEDEYKMWYEFYQETKIK